MPRTRHWRLVPPRSMKCRAALLWLLLAGPACAQSVVLPVEQFEAEAAGKTLYTRYNSDGGLSYAAEHHFRDRRVTLLHANGKCHSGRWEPRGDQICYIYTDQPDKWHCWTYHSDGTETRSFRLARSEPDAPPNLTVVKTDDQPLYCRDEFLGAQLSLPERQLSKQ